MHITLHFPFADVRRFIPDAIPPVWPLTPPRDFVRGFGRARERSVQTAERYPAQDSYCDARRALRFEAFLGKASLSHGGRAIRPYCTHRRLTGDRYGAMQLEVGIGSYAHNRPKCLSASSFIALLNNICRLPVSVHARKVAARTTLSGASGAVAASFLSATTYRGHSTEAWWVRAAKPLCLVVYQDEAELDELPKPARSIGSYTTSMMVPVSAPPSLLRASDGESTSTLQTTFARQLRFDIAHMNHEVHGVDIRVLFIATPRIPRMSQDPLRRLRGHLARVHTERECLKQVLRLLDADRLAIRPGEASSDRLESYLRAAFNRLERVTFEGLPQESLARAMEDGRDAISPEESQSILSRLDHARQAVRLQVTAAMTPGGVVINNINAETYVENNEGNAGGRNNQAVNFGAGATVHGPIVNGLIKDSFNTIDKSAASEELKAALNQLTAVVEKMLAMLPKDQATNVARDLQTIAAEATSPSPRRKWYELSATGLIDAAKFTGEFAGQVGKSLASVTKLLGFGAV